jgi:hypothetical protein
MDYRDKIKVELRNKSTAPHMSLEDPAAREAGSRQARIVTMPLVPVKGEVIHVGP